MTDFVARASKWRLCLALSASVAAVVLGAWITGFFGTGASPGSWIIGLPTVFFFGACVIILVLKLRDNSDLIRVSAEGIFFKPWSDVTIPWSEISGISSGSVHGQTFIALKLKDARKFPSSRLLGKLAAVDRLLSGGDIVVSLAGTNGHFGAAMEAIARHSSIGRTE